MPGKMARSAPRPPFGLPDAPVAVRTSRLSCGKAGKARIFTPVWDSSGESRLNRLREHLYIPVKKKNRKQIEADAVPNRHAAIHGLVVYRTAKNYTLRI